MNHFKDLSSEAVFATHYLKHKLEFKQGFLACFGEIKEGNRGVLKMLLSGMDYYIVCKRGPYSLVSYKLKATGMDPSLHKHNARTNKAIIKRSFRKGAIIRINFNDMITYKKFKNRREPDKAMKK